MNFGISNKKNFLDDRKRNKKPDLTLFKDNLPQHSIDLDAACPRCLAVEASKPGARNGELNCNCVRKIALHIHTDIIVYKLECY